MAQLRDRLSAIVMGDGRWSDDAQGISLGSSTLLDRLLDLLTIFRRPVPVPVKSRRR
jgi:hypothetical protein